MSQIINNEVRTLSGTRSDRLQYVNSEDRVLNMYIYLDDKKMEENGCFADGRIIGKAQQYTQRVIIGH